MRESGTGFEDLGIEPKTVEDVAERYLLRFRKTAMLKDTAAGKMIKPPSI